MARFGKNMKYRSLFISDTHIGTKRSQVDKLLDFIRDKDFDYIFLVGDIIDGWELQRKWYWNKKANTFIQKMLKRARSGTQIHYITGNHDEFMEEFWGNNFGGIEVMKESTHVTKDMKTYSVIHGHQFDGVLLLKAKWLQKIGSFLYNLLLDFNYGWNFIRRKLGLPYWSVSRWARNKTKEAVKYVARYEDALIDHARREEVDGVICGHIHKAEIRNVDGISYVNTGDWVESLTCVIEDNDGKLELIDLTSEESLVVQKDDYESK